MSSPLIKFAMHWHSNNAGILSDQRINITRKSVGPTCVPVSNSILLNAICEDHAQWPPAVYIIAISQGGTLFKTIHKYTQVQTAQKQCALQITHNLNKLCTIRLIELVQGALDLLYTVWNALSVFHVKNMMLYKNK